MKAMNQPATGERARRSKRAIRPIIQKEGLAGSPSLSELGVYNGSLTVEPEGVAAGATIRVDAPVVIPGAAVVVDMLGGGYALRDSHSRPPETVPPVEGEVKIGVGWSLQPAFAVAGA